MEIKEYGIDEIKPYEKNPRKNEDSVKFVANSIKEFGFKVPIVIDADNVIVAGHTRWKAERSRGPQAERPLANPSSQEIGPSPHYEARRTRC